MKFVLEVLLIPLKQSIIPLLCLLCPLYHFPFCYLSAYRSLGYCKMHCTMNCTNIIPFMHVVCAQYVPSLSLFRPYQSLLQVSFMNEEE